MKKINNNGQALVEYILIISLIAIIAVALVTFLGGYLKDAITKTSCDLLNKEYVEGEKPGEATCENILDLELDL